jgi:hypothetical protein
MSTQTLKDKNHRVIGYIETKDANHGVVGTGNLLAALITSSL